MSYAVIKDWYDDGFDGFGGIRLPSSAKLAPPPRPSGEIGSHEEQRRLSSGRVVTVRQPVQRPHRPGDFAKKAAPPPGLVGGSGAACPASHVLYNGKCVPTQTGAGGTSCSAPYILYDGKCVLASAGGGVTMGPETTYSTGGGATQGPETTYSTQGPENTYSTQGPENTYSTRGPETTYPTGGGVTQGPSDPVTNPGSMDRRQTGRTFGGGRTPTPGAGTGFGPSKGSVPSGGGALPDPPAPSRFSLPAPPFPVTENGAGARFSPRSPSPQNGALQRFRQTMTSPSPVMTPLSPDPGYGPWQTQHAYQAAQSAFAAQAAAAMRPGSNITVVTHVPPPADRGPASRTGDSVLPQSAAPVAEEKPFPWLLVAAVCAAGGGYYLYSKKSRGSRR